MEETSGADPHKEGIYAQTIRVEETKKWAAGGEKWIGQVVGKVRA